MSKAKTNYNFKQVTLSDGRVVTLRELTGADEMLALKICAKEMSLEKDEIGAGLMTQQNVLVVLSVLKFDDEPLAPPESLNAALQLMSTIKLRDWNRIRGAYNELNGGDEDFLTEPTA